MLIAPKEQVAELRVVAARAEVEPAATFGAAFETRPHYSIEFNQVRLTCSICAAGGRE